MNSMNIFGSPEMFVIFNKNKLRMRKKNNINEKISDKKANIYCNITCIRCAYYKFTTLYLFNIKLKAKKRKKKR